MVSPIALSFAQGLLLSYASCGNAAAILPRTLTSNAATLNATLTLPVPLLSNSTTPLADPLLVNSTGGPYTLPQNSNDPKVRQSTIQVVKANFLYGPSVAGGPYYPTGALGLLKNTADLADIQNDATPELALTATDTGLATAGISKYDGLKTLDDYTKLYQGEWTHILPKGPVPGILTNYTQDLLFSMQRLSFSPYAVRRLNPSDSLAFTVDDAIAQNVSGMTQQQLLQAGRLFYVDFSDQKNLTPSAQFSAAPDAFFFIDANSSEFLPLAVHSNVGSQLVYTPADSPADWLLAKIMYNVADFWFAQWNHLASTHEVVQIAWMAAIRSLSVDHPVFALLDRLMYEVFSIQPLAAGVLFAPGTTADETLPYTGPSAQSYSSNLYFNGGSGQFKANYFETELQNRGLINSTVGPDLKHFPFYEDASVIYGATHQFMTAFVNSYYPSSAAIANDTELQDWVNEAQGPAKAIDFPSINTPSDLIDVLTHMAHLVSSSHHTINTNELITVAAALPFNPLALYSAPPINKSANTNVVDFLPPFDKVLQGFTVSGIFARPLFVGGNRTLLHMFDDAAMLERMNSQTQTAAATFKSSMTAFSQAVGARTFDANGLSQGMPFVWQALDPNVAPYSVTT